MLTDYHSLIQQLVPDDANRIDNPELDQAIAQAVQRYSRDRPRQLVEDITPSDTETLPMPASWDDDESYLISLEYEIGENPPSIVAADQYYVYRSPAGYTIGLVGTVEVSKNVRTTYTRPHSLSSSTDTIPTQDRMAVASYAAGILCQQLATLYSGQTDSTIRADAVQHESKAQAYAARAKYYFSAYYQTLGIKEDRVMPASAAAAWDTTRSNLLRPRLW